MVVAKFRAQLSVVSERASVYLEKLQITFTRLQKVSGDELKEVSRQAEQVFRRFEVSSRRALEVGSRRALLAANEGAARLRAGISAASKKAMVQAHVAQEAAAAFGRTGAEKVQKLRRESESELRKLEAGCHQTIAATGVRIARLGPQVSDASKQVALKLEKAQNAVLGLARDMADKPRKIREAHLARENDLRNMMASSPDAVVVTDSGRRLVAANAKALELFGISEFNFGNFTLDTFVPSFDWRDSSFAGPEDRPQCKIRRLDGGLRVAEWQLEASIVPHRHLYRFRNAVPYKIALPRFARGRGSAASLGAPPDAGTNAAVPAQKAPHTVFGLSSDLRASKAETGPDQRALQPPSKSKAAGACGSL